MRRSSRSIAWPGAAGLALLLSLTACERSQSPYAFWTLRPGMPFDQMYDIVVSEGNRPFPCARRWEGFSQCTTELFDMPGTMEAITDSAGRVVRISFTPHTNANLYVAKDMLFDHDVAGMARRWNAVRGTRPARWPLRGTPGEARWATKDGRWRLTLRYDGEHQGPVQVTLADIPAVLRFERGDPALRADASSNGAVAGILTRR
jgi:hypothetical protein